MNQLFGSVGGTKERVFFFLFFGNIPILLLIWPLYHECVVAINADELLCHF